MNFILSSGVHNLSYFCTFIPMLSFGESTNPFGISSDFNKKLLPLFVLPDAV